MNQRESPPPQRCLLALLTFALYASMGAGQLRAEPLWQQLIPRKRVAADPHSDYTLSKDHGPWLIMAASFSGPRGENQARDLVLELRRQYNLSAYYYGMTFQLDDANPGRGMDANGAPIKRRYQRGDRVVEHAVLVGDFTAIDDPDAQRLLERIKHLTPATLTSQEGKETAQSLAILRQFQAQLRQKINGSKKKGPMGHAFLTRNPLLPREYFVASGVEEDVAKWNQGLEYSLLKCPGKYSIRVATFRGRTTLKSTNDDQPRTRTRKASQDDPLVIAGRNAHLLTVALREKGWEAYEFHDRHESYVTIGSFQQARTFPDGRIVIPDRDARIIIDTFGATTPNNIFNRPAPQDQQLEQERKQQFQQLFSKGRGQLAQGFYPKRFVGMPLDIYPKAVPVPRRSISSAYVHN